MNNSQDTKKDCCQKCKCGFEAPKDKLCHNIQCECHTPTEGHTQEFTLLRCLTCHQMTNHIGGECQKCKPGHTQEVEAFVRGLLQDTTSQEFYGDDYIPKSVALFVSEMIASISKEIEARILKEPETPHQDGYNDGLDEAAAILHSKIKV